MRGLTFILGIVVVVVSAGCAQVTPSDPAYLLLSANVPSESCEVLGTVTARADCACYDKLSYDRVRERASQKLQQLARQQYPSTDVVEVANVDLFLNNAVAHGVAYRCLAENSI